MSNNRYRRSCINAQAVRQHEHPDGTRGRANNPRIRVKEKNCFIPHACCPVIPMPSHTQRPHRANSGSLQARPITRLGNHVYAPSNALQSTFRLFLVAASVELSASAESHKSVAAFVPHSVGCEVSLAQHLKDTPAWYSRENI